MARCNKRHPDKAHVTCILEAEHGGPHRRYADGGGDVWGEIRYGHGGLPVVGPVAEALGEVIRERDELKRQIAALEAERSEWRLLTESAEFRTGEALARAEALERGQDVATKALAEVTAQASVMRGCIEEWRADGHLPPPHEMDAALAPDARTRLLERVAALEAVVSAARVAIPTTHMLDCDRHPLADVAEGRARMCTCDAGLAPAAFVAALARLDALKVSR